MIHENTKVVINENEKVEENEQTDIFANLIGEFVEEEPDEFENYDKFRLNELEHGDMFRGKPVLKKVETVQYHPDEPAKHRAKLLLVDEEDMELLEININLKNDGDIQKIVWKRSTLFTLISGLSRVMKGVNFTKNMRGLKNVDLNSLRELLNGISSDGRELTIEVVAVEGDRFDYNSFRVVEVS